MRAHRGGAATRRSRRSRSPTTTSSTTSTGCPEQKIHCSVMGAEALEAAVFNWAQKRGVDLEALGVDMHAARSRRRGGSSASASRSPSPTSGARSGSWGCKTIPEITNAIKAGGACMSCHHTPGRPAGPARRGLGPRGRRASCALPELARPARAVEAARAAPAGDLALPVRQAGGAGARRVRPPAARSATAATSSWSTSRTSWSTAG